MAGLNKLKPVVSIRYPCMVRLTIKLIPKPKYLTMCVLTHFSAKPPFWVTINTVSKRPRKGQWGVVSPIAFCWLWPPAIAGKVSEDDKIVVLKSAVSMNFFIWKTSSKDWLEDVDRAVSLLRIFNLNIKAFLQSHPQLRQCA